MINDLKISQDQKMKYFLFLMIWKKYILVIKNKLSEGNSGYHRRISFHYLDINNTNSNLYKNKRHTLHHYIIYELNQLGQCMSKKHGLKSGFY